MGAPVFELRNAAGLEFELFVHGAARRLQADGLLLNLFPGNVLEGGPANVWLRLRTGASPWQAVPLLGPASPLTASFDAASATLRGRWQDLALTVQLRLADDAPCWFWHVEAVNEGAGSVELSLVFAQDVGLASPQAVSINEFYVSQYIDWQPLDHPQRGHLLAARQNQAQAGGRYPWLLLGSLRRAASFATDALQFQGLAGREGAPPPALATGLPGERLQHEHALAALEDEAQLLAPGEILRGGFFASFVADHPAASAAADAALADAALARPEAQGIALDAAPGTDEPFANHASLFARAPMLATQDLGDAQIDALFGPQRLHAEIGSHALLSFFQPDAGHVVLRAKELLVPRAHGHMLRAGAHLVPDERALTSTCWMGGVFHSMLTLGHVKFGRLLSSQRSGLNLFSVQGLRAFVRVPGADWQLLGLPSAFAMTPDGARWIYAHGRGLLEVRAEAGDEPMQQGLAITVLEGAPLELLLCLHALIDDDDGGAGIALQAMPLQQQGKAWLLRAPPESTLGTRMPGTGLRLGSNKPAVAAGDDALLHEDGMPRGSGMFCLRFGALQSLRLDLRAVSGALDLQAAPAATPLALPRLQSSDPALQQLATMLPWLTHNALVHYLAPRGLEQFSGGGWGVRDVCQGPLELLLALGRTAPVRDLLLRVFSAQNADGDWPQWFMFFPRDAAVRAGDSHGDVVFWPLLGLARYLIASGDAALLDQPLPYHDAAAEPLIDHLQRALALIATRMIPGHALVAYGHGDWNDALQPADPSLRESLCSAWTVTLHHQVLVALADAFERLGRGDPAALRGEAEAVHAAFQRELVRDEVVAGYAHFPPGETPELWIHPASPTAGLHYSLLPMMHAVLDEMLTPAQARTQAALIEQHLSGPDGARLFDAPLPYQGGLSQRFLRAETSSFFGREIGIMYMHAHLRHAQMLAHLGQAEAFFKALSLSHPILLQQRVPSAGLRQANCYYSSSDAAFADRYAAQAEYAKVGAGTIRLDGGWRIYSSGPGIAMALVLSHLLGLRLEHDALVIDPVMPARLAGLRAEVQLADFTLELNYQPGSNGAGISALQDAQGRDLPFTRRHNLYRPGGAVIERPKPGQRLALTVVTN